MGAASLLVALAMAADHAYATGSIQAEVRGAAPLSAGSTTSYVPEVSVNPSLDTGLVKGAFRALLGYHPQFTLRGLTPALLHRVQAGTEWRLSPSRRALVDQSLSFGQYDTSLGNLGQGGALLPPSILPLATVDYLTSDTAVGFDGALLPRLRLRTALGYHVSGGLTDEARLLVPLQHGPRLTLELQHQATRRDALAAGVKVSADTFSLGRIAAVAESTAIWRAQLTRDNTFQLGAGAAAVASYLPGEAVVPAAAPVASASLNLGNTRARVALDARYAPQPDALSGHIYQQAGVGVTGDLRPSSAYTIRASFGGSWSVAGLNLGDRTLQGEASLTYRDQPLDVTVGVRVADAVLSQPTVTHATELRAFLGFSVKGKPVR